MSQKQYTREFKLDAVTMALSSKHSQAHVARELGVTKSTLYTWISNYRSEVLHDSHSLSEESELAALKKEVHQLRQEREILKKAAAYFAKNQA